jgi:hypothetical protein
MAARLAGFGRLGVAGEFEDDVVALVADVLAVKGVTCQRKPKVAEMPPWLVRPGRTECRERWPLVQSIYSDLTELELPETMRSQESRRVDAILKDSEGRRRVLEVDEKQHFNRYRAATLRVYPSDVPVAFDIEGWLRVCDAKRSLEGGGFGKPKPPLFPGEGGRHRQRAFRDALCDVLPPEHGWLPTLRVGKFESEAWLYRRDAKERMHRLLADRLAS